jgi:hypothetical protein
VDQKFYKTEVMRNTMHPNFLLGLFSLFLLILGWVLRVYGFQTSDYIWLAAFLLGGVHWVWAITDVFRHQHPGSQSRVLWAILVVAVPPVGGLFYYAMSKTVRM